MIRIPRSAILHLDILQRIGYIFASVRGLFEKFVDFLELYDTDWIFLLFKKFSHGGPPELIGGFLQPIDLDAVFGEGLPGSQCIKRLLEDQATGLYNATQFQHGARHRIDMIIDHPMHGILYAVDNIVQVRGERLDVFGVYGCYECGVETAIRLVKNAIGLFLKHMDLVRCIGQVCVPGGGALHQQAGRLADKFGLLLKVTKEFFVAGKQLHTGPIFSQTTHAFGWLQPSLLSAEGILRWFVEKFHGLEIQEQFRFVVQGEGHNQTMSQSNIEIAKSCYAAFARGDIAAILAALAEDIQWITPGAEGIPTAGNRKGRDEVKQFFESVTSTWTFTAFEPREYIANGDSVAALGSYEGISRATGKPLSASWAMVWKFRDGKVVYFREYTDTQALAGALKK